MSGTWLRPKSALTGTFWAKIPIFCLGNQIFVYEAFFALCVTTISAFGPITIWARESVSFSENLCPVPLLDSVCRKILINLLYDIKAVTLVTALNPWVRCAFVFSSCVSTARPGKHFLIETEDGDGEFEDGPVIFGLKITAPPPSPLELFQKIIQFGSVTHP